MEEQAHVSSGSSMMTRSIRGSADDFEALKAIAEKLGISQGATLSQLLSFWQLEHAVSESALLQKQRGNVEQLSGLLAQINDLFRSQLNAIATAEEAGKRAESVKTAELEQSLAKAQNDAQTARQELTAAKDQASKNMATAHDELNKARADAKTAEATLKQAEQEKAAAERAKAQAEQQMQSALASVASLKASLEDAQKQRDDAKAEAAGNAQKLSDAFKQLDAYKDIGQQLKDAQRAAETLKTANAELKKDLGDAKLELKQVKDDLRSAQADLRDLSKSFGERVDKERADAVAAVEPRIRKEYADKYNDRVKKLQEKTKKAQKHEPSEKELEADGQTHFENME